MSSQPFLFYLIKSLKRTKNKRLNGLGAGQNKKGLVGQRVLAITGTLKFINLNT